MRGRALEGDDLRRHEVGGPLRVDAEQQVHWGRAKGVEGEGVAGTNMHESSRKITNASGLNMDLSIKFRGAAMQLPQAMLKY